MTSDVRKGHTGITHYKSTGCSIQDASSSGESFADAVCGNCGSEVQAAVIARYTPSQTDMADLGSRECGLAAVHTLLTRHRLQ